MYVVPSVLILEINALTPTSQISLSNLRTVQLLRTQVHRHWNVKEQRTAHISHWSPTRALRHVRQ